MGISRFLMAGAAAVAIGGCAADLLRAPASFTALERADEQPARIRFADAVTVVPPSQYKREVKAGTHWKLVGRVAQGFVYRPEDSVFTLEGAHVHEAYLVISGRSLVGAYLPVERAFVNVEPVKALPLQAATD